MIASGEKKEEYREIKPYWGKRLVDTVLTDPLTLSLKPKHFDVIHFRNGYSKTAPTLTVECEMICWGYNYPQWSEGPKEWCFVIKLGKILSQTP